MPSFALDAQELSPRHRRLIEELKQAVQRGDAQERTDATMTLLKLCESEFNVNEHHRHELMFHQLGSSAYISARLGCWMSSLVSCYFRTAHCSPHTRWLLV